jgi:hypothetical protein
MRKSNRKTGLFFRWGKTGGDRHIIVLLYPALSVNFKRYLYGDVLLRREWFITLGWSVFYLQTGYGRVYVKIITGDGK